MEVISNTLRDHPPAYAPTPSAVTLRVNLKQTASLTDTPHTVQTSPRWARLLGVALSREWLHSSGVSAYILMSITPTTTFDNFDQKIRDRFREGAHGEPLRWLGWAYVLRGRWLGQGAKEQRVVLSEAVWEIAKVAMYSMLDVRIDLVFTFSQSGARSREARPPAYELSCLGQKDNRCRNMLSMPETDGIIVEEIAGDGMAVERMTWTRRACQLCPLKGLLEGHRFPLQRDRFHAVPSKIWSAEMAKSDKARSDSRC
ncbi:hypothetical protein LTR95_016125 [Oleoguttula sp. CCFEE 5521]